MATKKKEIAKPKKVLFSFTEAEREAIQMDANMQVEKFKTALMHKVTFGVLSKGEAKTEIKRHKDLAKGQRDKYEQKISKATEADFRAHYVTEYIYWDAYLYEVNTILGKEVEAKLSQNPKSLSEFFTGKMNFSDFQNLLERAHLTNKGKMNKREVAYKVLATFNVLESKGFLHPKQETSFRDAFTQYYTGAPFSRSAYTNARDRDKGYIEAYKDALNKLLK